MRSILKLASTVALFSTLAIAQASYAPVVIQTPTGQAIAGASVALCTSQPTTATPCGGSSLQQTYTDITLSAACQLNPSILGPMNGSGCTNPGLTNGYGVAGIYTNSGFTFYQAYGQGIVVTDVEPIQFGGSGGGSTGLPNPSNFPGNVTIPNGNLGVSGNTTLNNLQVNGTSNLNGLNSSGQINVNPPVNASIGFLPDPIVPYTVPNGDAQLGALIDPNNGCVEMAWNDAIGIPNINQYPLLLNKLPSYFAANSTPVWNPTLCGFDLASGGPVTGTVGDAVMIGTGNVVSDAGFLASNVAKVNGTNAFSATGTVDVSGSNVANAFRVPIGAGFTTSNIGAITFEGTGLNFHVGIGIPNDKIMAVLPTSGLTNGDCAQIDVSGSNVTLADSGTTCVAGSGTVSPNSVAAGAMAFYAAAGGSTTVSANPRVTENGTQLIYSGTQGIQTIAGSSSQPGYTFTSGISNSGWFSGSASSACWISTASTTSCQNSTGLEVSNTSFLGWSVSATATGTKNLSLSDDNSTSGLGVLDIGSGGSGTTGKIKASSYMSVGTKFTTNAGCSETTLVGGGSVGKFSTVGSTGCTTIVTMGDTATAPNGWACFAHDLTTSADYNNPRVSSNATTATIVTGTIVSGDVIEFGCIGY